jgi:hypothetical protein
MENEFLKIYSNLANYHITKNVEFLKSEYGTKLLKEVERFCELWSIAKSLALKAFRSGKEDSAMHFIINFVWFPSQFSLTMNILVSASDSVIRTIRFVLEGLELGLVLDCADEFKNLSLEEKLEIAKEFNSKGSLCLTKYEDKSKYDKESDGKEHLRLVDLLDKLLEENTLRELKRFYGMISEKWIHASTHLTNLMTDESIKEWPPPKVLYFPPLEERKDEADELAEILREFNKYADILIKEWGKRYIG